MMNQYILSFDQSTSTTKALLFDQNAALVGRADIPHRQIVNDLGWVEHDANEILANVFKAAEQLLLQTGVDCTCIKAVSISNQRETALAWDRTTGKPLHNAIVWQCTRAQAICEALASHKVLIHAHTGLHLSPYFSAAKFSWLLKHVAIVKSSAENQHLVLSTMDSFLLYNLSEEKVVKTDFSNASRTQLLHLKKLQWDGEVAELFDIPPTCLPELCDSNAIYGHTTLGGLLKKPVPICGVLGDSQGALFAQGCLQEGLTKATYGTGSSIMMNIGSEAVLCDDLVTSIAWGMDGKITYVLEGNINYSGATISYLIENLGLIASAKEAGKLAQSAKDVQGLYMVPAFSGLGAPYWDADARALIIGLDRRTGKAELVKAAEQAIAYQIADIVFLMQKHSKQNITSLRVDGGPTNDSFLMQFQADVLQSEVRVANLEELSGQGPALLAALKLGILDRQIAFNREPKALYHAVMNRTDRDELYKGWQKAVAKALSC
jgi:glycerol kinase